jgi:L-asparaginase II
VVESLHIVNAAVVTAEGKLVASHGDPGWITVYRSAAKPFQALPLVDDGVVDRFALSPADLALAAASHNGEEEHLAGVRGILRKVGMLEEALGLGPLAPLRKEAVESLYRAGLQVKPIHNNCSGQHAAMLGLAKVRGWEVGSYLDPRHPLQGRMLEEMVRYTALPRESIRTMPDGCGMLAFAVPLRHMARSFGALGSASKSEEGPGKVLRSMVSHPFMVGGTDRLCTELIGVTGGRVVGKLGAQGVYGMTIPEEGLGIALKVQDGGMRAGDAAAVRVLDLLGLLNHHEAQSLGPFRASVVRNTLGEEVGEVSANFDLVSGGRA